MDSARISELLTPFLNPAEDLTPRTQDLASSISTYINILIRWNSRINLTAIRDPEEIVTRHFGESLFAARHLFPAKNYPGSMPAAPEMNHVTNDVTNHVGTAAPGRPAEQSSAAAEVTPCACASQNKTVSIIGRGRAALQGREKVKKKTGVLAPEAAHYSLADIGSGAGFPGIPIKLWAPHVSLTLIESNLKKATFLREVVRALTLTDINIQNARAETLPPASFEVVTLRAVERFHSILPVAANMVAPGGRLALLIGSSQFGSADQALANYSCSKPLRIPFSKSRILVIAQRRS
ncbi:MAG: 16S rRNA (guanine(527)-N(7))-methyltransferase RsmG [Candidatus Sulfotelmatobacter sp.]